MNKDNGYITTNMNARIVINQPSVDSPLFEYAIPGKTPISGVSMSRKI
jgi:hypothetical protein